MKSIIFAVWVLAGLFSFQIRHTIKVRGTEICGPKITIHLHRLIFWDIVSGHCYQKLSAECLRMLMYPVQAQFGT